jgi:carboxyl-terminal processing protease
MKPRAPRAASDRQGAASIAAQNRGAKEGFMSSLLKKIVVAFSLLVVAYVTTGFVLGRSSDDKAFRALTVYSEVLAHIQHDYVDEPKMHQVTSGSLHGLLSSLDPESSYLSPLEYADYKEKIASKSKGEAGLALTRRGYIGVISVLPDSPAQKAGLRPGDILEEIAGFTTDQMAIDQAQLLFTGEPGTTVKMSVIRRGKAEPQAMEIVLGKLPVAHLTEDKLQGDIAYLRVPAFQAGMTKQLREKLVDLDHQGVHKLMLDLRGCAVGDVAEGISAAQLFLSSGTITTLKGQTVTSVPSTADPSKTVWTHPVTVLIGDGTAGAAEVLAAAIADNKRGETVGDRTYGTASMQKLITLEDGSALILTVANYYTPAGKEIPADGVTPTIEARPTLDDLAALNQKNPDAAAQAPSTDDPVVHKAIEVLEGSAARKAA